MSEYLYAVRHTWYLFFELKSKGILKESVKVEVQSPVNSFKYSI